MDYTTNLNRFIEAQNSPGFAGYNNALEEIHNNSSYFFTTKVASTTIRNYLRSDYNIIVDSYQDFANIILNLSELINKGGNNG